MKRLPYGGNRRNRKNNRRTAREITLILAGCFLALSLRAQVPPSEKNTAGVSAPATSSSTPGPSAGGTHSDISSASKSPEVYEDWSTPSLNGSHLKASEAIVGETDLGDPAYSLDTVRLEWRAADPIDLYIIKPAGIAKPPVVLYLYSYPSDNDRYRNNQFRKFLTKNGFAAVGFVSALTGQRYHMPRPLKQWFVSQMQESLATSAHDVQMILNYLAAREDLDMDHVGMFGDGSGASIAILAAAADPRIKTLDLVNPWGDWPDWMAKSSLIPEHERPDYLKPEFLAGVAPLDPVEWLPKLKTQTIRLTEVDNVTVTPGAARRKIEAALPANGKVVRFADTKAFLNSISGGTAFDWLKQQMADRKSRAIQVAGQPQANASRNNAKP
jgi:hypothetical protein